MRSGLGMAGGCSKTSSVEFNFPQLLVVFPSGGLGGHVTRQADSFQDAHFKSRSLIPDLGGLVGAARSLLLMEH